MIETERLIFREYQDDDFDALAQIICDSETMIHYPKPYDENDVKRWINWNKDNYQKYGFGLWVLILKETGEMIGDCGLTIQNIDNELLPEIGYHINKKYWRQGYGKEAGLAVRNWAFENTDYDSLYSYMKYTNIASYSLASSLGMKRIKEYEDPDDKITYVYQIKREDWCKKNILVSACLLGYNCRYDGNNCLNNNIIKLKEKYHFIPVCPEQLGGLNTPRKPAEIIGDNVYTIDKKYVTNEYLLGAKKTLEIGKKYNCQYAILKQSSPSCGSSNIYDGTFSGVKIEGKGITTKLLEENGIIVFSENDIDNLEKILNV